VPLTRAETVDRIGHELTGILEAKSFALYSAAHEHALERGIILADTKFEFGLLNGEVIHIDEALTPDSSRFWPLDGYQPGRTPSSLDKQPIRDATEATGWNKQPPPPPLSDDVVMATSNRYREAFQRLTSPA
jgi:phosphoribosylaminoimidazole-succinocarboxamide synthase